MGNICKKCLITNGEEVPDLRLFDTGECGECGAFGEVADPDLLGLYRGLDIPVADVWSYLPRVRQHRLTFSDLDRPEVPLSTEFIGNAVKSYLFRSPNTARQNKTLDVLNIQAALNVNGEFAANRLKSLYERWNQAVILTEVELDWLGTLYTTTDDQRTKFDEDIFIENIRNAEPSVLYALKAMLGSRYDDADGYIAAFELAKSSFPVEQKVVPKSRKNLKKKT